MLLFFHRNLTLLYIFMMSVSPSSVAGNIKWTLKEKPAIFGTNIHLVCHLPKNTSCCNDDRKWNNGYQYNLIIINSLSYNKSKYKEDLHVKKRVSILTVFSLSSHDVNIPYECVYGYRKYRSTLELTEDVFEFHPTEILPVVPDIKGYNISFHIQFKKVYPKPLCRAALGVQNLSSFLYVTVNKNDLFYQSTLTFSYSSSEKRCEDSLRVLCTLGKTVLTVVDHKICSLSEAKEYLVSIVLITSVVFVVVISIIITVIVCRRRGFKNLKNQHLNNNTEELTKLQSLHNSS